MLCLAVQVYCILDEFIIGGEIQETSKKVWAFESCLPLNHPPAKLCAGWHCNSSASSTCQYVPVSSLNELLFFRTVLQAVNHVMHRGFCFLNAGHTRSNQRAGLTRDLAAVRS
jgi:hypothetical protein